MKLLHAIAVLAVAWTTANAQVAPTATTPPSYPLRCRGGAGMKIMVNHDVDAAGVPGATAMFIHFKWSAKPARIQEPLPGECGWLDRTVRTGEPSVMWIKSPKIEFAFQVMGDGKIVVDTTGPRVNVEGATLSPEAKNWQYLVDGVLRGQLFTAKVYNESGRVMVVTGVGP